MTDIVNVNFVGIGVAKSGTTWLARCLAEHPQIFLPDRKELFFFDSQKGRNYTKGIPWYNSFFEPAEGKQLLGEFTNHYMYYPESSFLISKHLPGVKVIACLRSPVSMAYSMYWWRKSNIESDDLADTFEGALTTDKHLVRRGLYYQQLKPFFDFFPRENIKVVFFEDIKSKPEKLVKEMYEFLEVAPSFVPASLNTRINVTKKIRFQFISNFINAVVRLFKRSSVINNIVWDILSDVRLARIYWKLNKVDFKYPPMTPELFGQTLTYYIDDIEKLEGLLNKNLSNWKVLVKSR